MKNLSELTRYRSFHPTMGFGDLEGGLFKVQSPIQKDRTLNIIASTGEGWDHVSVSLPHRTPVWQEMDFVKRLFFNRDEVVMQLHPAEKDHVNIHPYCLHLWRPQNKEIPLPELYLI